MAKTLEGKAKSFLFRELFQNILFGTASDRYAGWVGQIYSEGRYGKGITRRSHKVGDKTFNEETLPVESATEYFEHFPVLEIDYTFYRLLLRRGRLAEEVVNILTEEGKDLEARFAKVGRNDPRPYGSRKKFKTCHGH